MHLPVPTSVFLLGTASLEVAIPQPCTSQSILQESVNVTQLSKVPFGSVINHCTVSGTIALTFDDGPWIYTAQMLDLLAEHGAHATFFLNGANRGHIDAYPDLVKRALNEGHQLGSHTWSHPYLPNLSKKEIASQMTDLESSFERIIGRSPTYMRAPYLLTNNVVLSTLNDLGYHVIGTSIDTKDFENDRPDTNWRSYEKFLAELNAGGNIVLAHDTYRTTVELLMYNMLDAIEVRGLTTVTVGECLGDPPALWYRESR
ncbi:Glycoside hydrolase/deacetylase beta/alpha-barrel [Penicillium taxi]|uniref:Glycoside hydrolase/deacetylase beta/alpha-barrel n=1 Tax=Penicillium taxi TaxID=168475 RepID=UPI0025451D66|nr:Glycoside hydrolase/deacetylase beta/alpha-barrel [Penicillium taxi]KAJ5899769.1 Glycoside hydrolase/deacetylase beta/alpha-barrel [Penicillium taxi]